MKMKKTITDKTIAANRANAKRSTGPRNMERVRLNALTHGFLSKKLVFPSEESKAEFAALLAELETEYEPFGRTEQALIEEVAVCLWKLQALNGWEQLERDHCRKASTAILRSVAENSDDKPLPLFTNDDGSRSAAQLSWECKELIVRTGTSTSEREETLGGDDRNAKSGNTQIEARLSTSGDSLLRYAAATKRDFYRAIGTLRDIQRDRREQAE